MLSRTLISRMPLETFKSPAHFTAIQLIGLRSCGSIRSRPSLGRLAPGVLHPRWLLGVVTRIAYRDAGSQRAYPYVFVCARYVDCAGITFLECHTTRVGGRPDVAESKRIKKSGSRDTMSTCVTTTPKLRLKQNTWGEGSLLVRRP